MSDQKRKRSQNFTHDDKDRLVKLLCLHKETVLNKKTDGTSNEAKARAWNELTSTFNLSSKIYRSKDSLIKLWEKLKSEAKIYWGTIEQTSAGSGGPSNIKIDPVLDQVCQMLGIACRSIDSVQDYNADSDNEEPLAKIFCTQPIAEVNFVVKDNPFETDPALTLQNTDISETTSILSSGDKDLIQSKVTTESLKQKLMSDEIEFKRKLYKLQLQTAAKELEIKSLILQQLKDGSCNGHGLSGV